ncbi:MAG: TonB-dependent receptor [Deltaproteobacteria bacterium]|nr:TonB-dependent receptor [Deltaproteobacteria bacterium]
MDKTFKKYKAVFILAVLSMVPVDLPGLPVAPAQAGDPGTPILMDEVVVTATRNQEEISRVPANVTVITASEIEKSGATSLVEVLEKLESVQFRSYSGNPSQAQIDLRGFGGDNPYGKNLVLLDGRRLNRPDMSSVNWLQIPLHNVERIEVVRGAGSVLYGDAAIGGVINVITKKGKGEPTFNASVLAGSYGLHDERIGVNGATDQWTYALTGENNFSSGYRDRSKYSSRGGGLDVGYSANDLLNVSLGLSFHKVDYQMPGALTKEQMEQDRRQYQPAMPLLWMNAHPDDDGSDEYTNANVGITSFWGPWGQLEVNLLYGKKELQMNMPSWTSYNYSDTTSDTYGITPRYVLEKEIFGFRNKTIIGLDYYHEPYKKDIFGDRERTAQLSTADFTRESLGFYLRDEFSPLKNLIISAGYRFERASIEGSNVDFSTPANGFTDQKNTYRAEAYEAGLTWLWGKRSKAFAKYTTVYRIPFLDEVASFSGFGGVFLTELEKEKGISLEAGTEFYPIESLKIGLTVFRIDMEDEIEYVYDPLTFTGKNQNTGKTRHDGAEISLSYLWRTHLKIFGNYTYHKATFEDGINDGKEMPLVPQHMANAGLEMYLPLHVTLRPEIQYVSKAYLSGDNDNNTEQLEDHTLLNLYVLYKPAFGKLDLTVFLGVDNIADEKYSSFGIDYEQYSFPGVTYPNFYYPMPGRTFKGGVSLTF